MLKQTSITFEKGHDGKMRRNYEKNQKGNSSYITFCKNGHVFCKNTILKKCSISTFLKFLFVWSLRMFLTCSWHFIYIFFFRGSPTKKNLLFISSENLYFKLLKPLATFLACSYLKNKKRWYKVSLKCCRYARIRS